ncbi:MAG: hypothetical protein ACR2O3_04795 [Rhizobiaceae bacterium]
MSRNSALFSFFAIGAFCLESVAASAPVVPRLEVDRIAEQNLIVRVDGCHANTRYHYVDEIGDEARHKHKGNSCRPVIIETQSENYHCHSDGRKHRHSGFGNKVHSHYGNSCRVDVWNQSGGSGTGQGCVKVGPVLFCP